MSKHVGVFDTSMYVKFSLEQATKSQRGLWYSCTPSLTSALHMGVCGQRHASAALPPGKRPGTPCIGGWVGLRAGLDGRVESRPSTGIRSPDLPARSESPALWVVDFGGES